MRLTFGKLTAAASVAVVTALTWSGSAQAAPQILGLVASNGPIPLKWAMSLSLLKFVGQASLVDDAMLPS